MALCKGLCNLGYLRMSREASGASPSISSPHNTCRTFPKRLNTMRISPSHYTLGLQRAAGDPRHTGQLGARQCRGVEAESPRGVVSAGEGAGRLWGVGGTRCGREGPARTGKRARQPHCRGCGTRSVCAYTRVGDRGRCGAVMRKTLGWEGGVKSRRAPEARKSCGFGDQG